jgi:hypothetical protein
VTFKGRPLPEGLVTFLPAQGRAKTGRAHEGEYEVRGVPVGPAKITVRQIVDPFAGGPKSPGGKEIPLRYRSADDSGLRYTVVAGAQAHDIELTE